MHRTKPVRYIYCINSYQPDKVILMLLLRLLVELLRTQFQEMAKFAFKTVSSSRIVKRLPRLPSSRSTEHTPTVAKIPNRVRALIESSTTPYSSTIPNIAPSLKNQCHDVRRPQIHLSILPDRPTRPRATPTQPCATSHTSSRQCSFLSTFLRPHVDITLLHSYAPPLSTFALSDLNHEFETPGLRNSSHIQHGRTAGKDDLTARGGKLRRLRISDRKEVIVLRQWQETVFSVIGKDCRRKLEL